MKLSHAFLGALLVAYGASAAAQWQWLDKDGRTVFSDRAPGADIPDKNILKRPRGSLANPTGPAVPSADAPGAPVAPSPALAASKAGGDKVLEAKRKQVQDAEMAKRKAEEERIAQTKAENCARAQQIKATFDSGARVARSNAAGEREMMDDASRAAEVKRIQGVIDSDCK